MRAFDMSKYQRIIATEGRIRGDFKVLGGVGRNPDHLIITPIDVVIYDPELNFGRCFYSNDFTVTLEDGVVKLSGPRNADKMADIEDVREEFDAIIRLVGRAYFEGAGSIADEATE